MTNPAEVHYFKSDYERAERELQKVLTIDPTFLNARLNLVKVRYKRGASYFVEDAEFQISWNSLQKSQTPPQETDTVRLEELLAKRDEKGLQKAAEETYRRNLKVHPEVHLSFAKQYLVDWREREMSPRTRASIGGENIRYAVCCRGPILGNRSERAAVSEYFAANESIRRFGTPKQKGRT